MSYEVVLGKIEDLDLMYNIRKFADGEGLERSFEYWDSRESFELEIVKTGIEGFRDLLRMIDKLGYSAKKSPKAIIADLAESVLEQNPHFRAQNPEFAEMSEKERKRRENAEERYARKVALDDLELKTLQNAKNTILRIFVDSTDSEIAEKLDISEKRVKTLKSRNWTFRDCLSIAGKLDLDVEVVFGRFRDYKEV